MQQKKRQSTSDGKITLLESRLTTPTGTRCRMEVVAHKITRILPYIISPKAKWVHIVRAAYFRTHIPSGEFDTYVIHTHCSMLKFMSDHTTARSQTRVTNKLSSEQYANVCPHCWRAYRNQINLSKRF